MAKFPLIATRPVDTAQGMFTTGEPHEPRNDKERALMLARKSWREGTAADLKAWAERVAADPALEFVRAATEPAAENKAEQAVQNKMEGDGKNKDDAAQLAANADLLKRAEAVGITVIGDLIEAATIADLEREVAAAEQAAADAAKGGKGSKGAKGAPGGIG